MQEKWRIGTNNSVVVSNVKSRADDSGHNETDYYGGFLVCESVATKEYADLIASAPDMKNMLRMFINAIEGATPDDQGCYTQRFGKAMLDEAKRIISE